MMRPVCLAILNYNGIRHLEAMLPSVRAALAEYPGVCRAVVLDNGSTQSDVAWVSGRFPEIEVVSAPANDFLFSYNWLLPQLSEDIVVLLNNDLRLTPGFLAPLIRHFEHDDVFAVSATSLDWEGRAYTCGPARLRNHHGWYYWGYDTNCQRLSHTLFASGGFSAVSRAKFLELGGFNRVFHPAYCEDLDLSFRAWRRGWRSVFEPASVVYHRESASWGKDANGQTRRLALRGQLLFSWLTLPPARRLPARYLMYARVMYLNWRSGRTRCFNTWFQTAREWRRMRSKHGNMKVSHHELDTILKRIAEAVPVAPMPEYLSADTHRCGS